MKNLKQTLEEQLEQWAKALDSGEYKQDEDRVGCLWYKQDNSYCCLGVLGRIFDAPEKFMVAGFLREDHCKEPLTEANALIHKMANEQNMQVFFMELNDAPAISRNMEYYVMEKGKCKDYPNPLTFKEIAEVIRNNKDKIVERLMA